MESPPNILYIFPDQLGARWLSTDGNSTVITPRLEAFARQSFQFTNAYTTSPLCTPYRGTLLTGRYPSQTGVINNGMALPPEETTLAHLFNAGGYHTHYIGKWHLGGPPGGNHWVAPEKRGGFQRFIGWESHHVNHMEGRIWRDDPSKPVIMAGHETDGLTDIVLDELHTIREPFIMFVAYQAPHPPCTPLERHLNLYADRNLLSEPNVVSRDIRFRYPQWDNLDLDLPTFRARYYGEISHIDDAFGRLLDTLDALPCADNTIVVFTSDHGELNGAHGQFGKGTMYEEAVRVPLMIRMPRQQHGVTVDCPVSTIDILPTLIDLAGLPAYRGAIGESFAPTLRGTGPCDPSRPVIMEYHGDHQNPNADQVGDLTRLALVWNGWKLIADVHKDEVTARHALFNLSDDPYELNNCLNDQREQTRIKQMTAVLTEWTQTYGGKHS